MSEKQAKKKKMNILGYISIAISAAIMIYSKFTHTEGAVWERLLNGVWVYGLCFFGAGLITLAIYIGMYFANMFFNEIYDERNEPPAWDNADHMIFVFFVVLYVSDLAGWIKLL